MKVLKFKGLKLEGFASFQESTVFKLDRGGSVTLIKGSTGDGKTTLIGAIIWCLFGEIVKNISGVKAATWEETRKPTFKGTRVVVTFEKDGCYYMVVRHLKFKGKTTGITGGDRLLFYKKSEKNMKFSDEHIIESDRNKRLIQQGINRVLGLDYEQAKQSMYFGQRMARLIESSKEEKAQLFEDIFDAIWLRAAKENAKNSKAEILQDIQANKVPLQNVINEIEQKNRSINSQKEILNNFNNNKTVRVAAIRYELQELSTTISDIQDKIRINQKLYSKFDESNSMEMEKELNNLLGDKSGQDIQVKFANLQAEYKDSLQELEDILSTLKEDFSAKRDELDAKLYEDNLTANIEKDKLHRFEAVEEGKIEDIENILLKLNKINSQIVEEKTTAFTNIEKLKNSIAGVVTVCPTCEQKLSIDKIENTKKEIRNKIVSEKDVIQVLEKAYSKNEINISNTSNNCKNLKSNLKVLRGSHRQKLTDTNAGIAKMEESLSLYKKKAVVEIGEMEKKIQTIRNTKGAELFKMRGEIDIYDKNRIDKISELREDIFENIENNKIYKAAKDIIIELQATEVSTKKFIAVKEQELVREKNIQPPETQIQGITDKVIILNSEKKVAEAKLQNLQDELEKVQWWYTLGFGAKGVKSYIFTAGLARLNKTIEKYANKLGYRIKFSIDLDSINKSFKTSVSYTKNNKTFEKDYEEFSGGEKQQVAIAIAFAMFDIISEKLNCNLMIMDEVFEGLSSEKVEAVFNLIRIKASEGKTVLIITHSDEIDSKYAKSIRVFKEDGISYIEEH